MFISLLQHRSLPSSVRGKGIDPMKTLKIGIDGYDRMKAHTLAIARGDYKPGRGEPKVWFTSVESFAKVLSQRNCELLALITREQPTSLTELAELSGRKKSNLPPDWSDQLDQLNRVRAVHGTTALEGNPLSEAAVSQQIGLLSASSEQLPSHSREEQQVRNASLAQDWVRQRFVPGSRPLSDIPTLFACTRCSPAVPMR